MWVQHQKPNLALRCAEGHLADLIRATDSIRRLEALARWGSLDEGTHDHVDDGKDDHHWVDERL